LKMIKI